MNNFKNKTVVITGAGSGIGKALAIEFAQRGASIALCDNDKITLEQTVDEVKKFGITIFSKQVDVSQNEEIIAFANDVKLNIGAVDVLINNAGVGHGKITIEESSVQEMERIMNINFWGMVYGTKAFLPQLKKQERTSLVNISSIAGLISVGHQASYAASKFAIRAVTEGLMMELKDEMIKVHSVHPGGIKTNIVKTALGGDPNYNIVFEKIQTQTPEYAAKKIIRGIEKNKRRIIVGTDAKIAFFAARILPLHIFNYFQLLFLKQMEKRFKKTHL